MIHPFHNACVSFCVPERETYRSLLRRYVCNSYVLFRWADFGQEGDGREGPWHEQPLALRSCLSRINEILAQ